MRPHGHGPGNPGVDPPGHEQAEDGGRPHEEKDKDDTKEKDGEGTSTSGWWPQVIPPNIVGYVENVYGGKKEEEWHV